jgi:hypothetical protein
MWSIIAIDIYIMEAGAMRTIQMTLDDELVATVDQVVKKLKTYRVRSFVLTFYIGYATFAS